LVDLARYGAFSTVNDSLSGHKMSLTIQKALSRVRFTRGRLAITFLVPFGSLWNNPTRIWYRDLRDVMTFQSWTGRDRLSRSASRAMSGAMSAMSVAVWRLGRPLDPRDVVLVGHLLQPLPPTLDFPVLVGI
jgi:hypothetical protein